MDQQLLAELKKLFAKHKPKDIGIALKEYADSNPDVYQTLTTCRPGYISDGHGGCILDPIK